MVCWPNVVRSSFKFGNLEPDNVPTVGRPRPGPTCSRTPTSWALASWMSSPSDSHHSVNSSVYVTSHIGNYSAKAIFIKAHSIGIRRNSA